MNYPEKHDNPSTPLHVLHCQVTKKEVNISSIHLHVLHCPVTKKEDKISSKPVKKMSAIQ